MWHTSRGCGQTFLRSIPAHCTQTRSATDKPAVLNTLPLDAETWPRALCIISSVVAFPIWGKRGFLSLYTGKNSLPFLMVHLPVATCILLVVTNTWICKPFCSLVICPRQALFTFTQTWLKRGGLKEVPRVPNSLVAMPNRITISSLTSSGWALSSFLNLWWVTNYFKCSYF